MEEKHCIAVSACLLGLNCKYNGKNNRHEELLSYLEGKRVIPVCPECYGGLPIPRQPAEIAGGDGHDVLSGKAKVLSKDGKDLTESFLRGADNMVKVCQMLSVSEAILKENSPSCGVTHVYDGSFSGTKNEGQGVFSARLSELGVALRSEKDF